MGKENQKNISGEISQEIYEALGRELQTGINEQGAGVTVSSILDEAGGGGLYFRRLNKEDIKLQILESCATNANSIYSLITSQEAEKNGWRRFFICFFCVILLASLGFTGVIIAGSASGAIKVPDGIIISLFTYVIANIFTILYFMLKYINNSRYLDMFKTVTHKMLDYLVQDKDNHS